MGFSYHKTDDDFFITIDGKPWTDFHPNDVAKLIASLPKEEKEIIEALIENRLVDKYEEMTGIPLPDNYAEHAGRPPLSEVPYMSSENDGYPFLPGHSPLCNGKPYYQGMCKCEYNKWNTYEVSGQHMMWPGGPDIDDFDM